MSNDQHKSQTDQYVPFTRVLLDTWTSREPYLVIATVAIFYFGIGFVATYGGEQWHYPIGFLGGAIAMEILNKFGDSDE